MPVILSEISQRLGIRVVALIWLGDVPASVVVPESTEISTFIPEVFQSRTLRPVVSQSPIARQAYGPVMRAEPPEAKRSAALHTAPVGPPDSRDRGRAPSGPFRTWIEHKNSAIEIPQSMGSRRPDSQLESPRIRPYPVLSQIPNPKWHSLCPRPALLSVLSVIL